MQKRYPFYLTLLLNSILIELLYRYHFLKPVPKPILYNDYDIPKECWEETQNLPLGIHFRDTANHLSSVEQRTSNPLLIFPFFPPPSGGKLVEIYSFTTREQRTENPCLSGVVSIYRNVDGCRRFNGACPIL